MQTNGIFIDLSDKEAESQTMDPRMTKFSASKGKVVRMPDKALRHEGVLWEWRYSSTHS
jgi:hypothetical protein